MQVGGALALDACLLAKIFDGQITTWDDAEIKAPLGDDVGRCSGRLDPVLALRTCSIQLVRTANGEKRACSEQRIGFRSEGGGVATTHVAPALWT